MRTVTQKLFSGSVLRSFSLISNCIVAFTLFPFLVHHLGDRLYGFWSLVAAFVSYYSLLDFGLGMTVCQYISGALGRNDTEECNSIFNSALRIYAMLGFAALLVTMVLAAFAPVICSNPQDASLFWKVIIILGVSVAISFPVKAFLGLLFAGLRFEVTTCVDLMGLALRTGLIVWVVLTGHKLLALAMVTLLASLPGYFLVIWLTKRAFPWLRIHAAPMERKTTRSLVSYSIYVFVADIGNRLRFQIDPLVIASFIGLVAVTHYRVASSFSGYYMDFMISIMGVLQPLLSQLYAAKDEAKFRKTFFFGTKISLCISSFLCFGLIGWGKPFIDRWMGSNYTDAYIPLVVLTVAIWVDLCQSPSVNLLYASFNHRFYAYVNLGEGVINLAISLMLARRYGILGVSLGTLIAAIIIRIIIQPWWVCKVSKISYSLYMRFLVGNLLRSAALIGVVFVIVSWGLRPDYRYLVSSSVLATVLFALGSWFVVLNKDEREHLWANLKKKTTRVTTIEAAAIMTVPTAASDGQGRS